MPDVDAFGVLEAIAGRASPAIVFVTAFDRYALRAFEVQAVDYLLKPFDSDRFREAFARAKSRVAAGQPKRDEERLSALIAEYVSTLQTAAPSYLDRVAIKVDGSLRVVRTADVDYWETDGNYVRLHVGAADHLLRSTSTAMEAQLDPALFIRVHRRYIVNVDRIVEVQPWFAGDAIAVFPNRPNLRPPRTYPAPFP